MADPWDHCIFHALEAKKSLTNTSAQNENKIDSHQNTYDLKLPHTETLGKESSLQKVATGTLKYIVETSNLNFLRRKYN